MEDLKIFRKNWSANQKELRAFFKSGSETQARELFLIQHAVLHSQEGAGSNTWSYPDLIFKRLGPDHYRLIPDGMDHSLSWILWHISRIEDITMNILVAGEDQIYLKGGWKERLGCPLDHTGNAGPENDIPVISSALDREVLLAYRNAVGNGTRAVFQKTPARVWNDRVDPERLARLVKEGAVLAAAQGLLAYWGKRRIFELFLMPSTRHLMSHLNEAKRVKDKAVKQLGQLVSSMQGGK